MSELSYPAPAPRAVTTAADPGSPREEIRPGFALVELRRGLAPSAHPVRPAQPSSGPGLRAAADPDYRLGGVALRLERALFDEPASGDEALDADRGAGALYLFALPDGGGLLGEPETRAALTRIAGDPRVRRAEPDRVRRAAAVPNDPRFADQWGLEQIRVPQAWSTTTGSESVVVAVLDTGIVHGHPDLESRLVPGYDFIVNPDSAADGDGRRDDDPTDTGGVDSSRLHGLHVAGIIGAVTGNGRGIAGVDQKCRIMPVRVLGVRGGDGVDSDIADAVRWAAGAQVGGLPRTQTPAQVLNMSFGGPGTSFTLQRAINDATGRGALVVAAAGNGGADASTYSPGGLDGVISVGAIARAGLRAEYSNYGARVDVLAPGGDTEFPPDPGEEPDGGSPAGDLAIPEPRVYGVLSTYRDDGDPEKDAPPFTYGILLGTSQAAPHVSGAASLAKAVLPRLRQKTFGALVRSSANARYRCDLSPLGGCGAGLLDAEKLLLLTGLQSSCDCAGDLFCLDGKCIEPPDPHDSAFAGTKLRSGWFMGCALAPGAARPAGARVPGVPASGAALLGVWALFRRRGIKRGT